MEWIVDYLTNKSLGNYEGWIDDLIRLCRSHHQGYQDLVKDVFNPRIVGSPAMIVHLRYLACALRLADVLDFDPERVPDVILKHRAISRNSLIYWWKDPQISILIDSNRPVIAARANDARIHRAVEITVDQIDNELRLCRTIADETHFQKSPGLNIDLPHRWDLLSSAHRDIKAKEGTYEYVNGSFRPDTEKLLKLLSGTELYHDPLIGVRELLQNSFDAVHEQIAYQRLSQKFPNDPIVISSLGRIHSVELRLEVAENDSWLTCSDTGIGMTKEIIENYLLVSGISRRHDILELARRCEHAGFRLSRTGKFGIGVLSYFMLADQIEIVTRRSTEPGDAEQNGWRFITDGVGTFGELQRDTIIQRGTTVRLHLRREIFGKNPLTWYGKLCQFIKDTLIHIPCKLEINTSLSKGKPIYVEAGWVLNLSDQHYIDSVLYPITSDKSIKEKRKSLVSKLKKENLVNRKLSWSKVKEYAIKSLRSETQEGNLLFNLGTYRIHLFYFDIDGEKSLAYLPIERRTDSVLMSPYYDEYFIYPPSTYNRIGWKGIHLISDYRRREFPSESKMLENYLATPSKNILVEINLDSDEAGNINVKRDILIPSNNAISAIKEVNKICTNFVERFIAENQESRFSFLNNLLVEKRDRDAYKTELALDNEYLNKSISWVFMEGKHPDLIAKWVPMPYPITNPLFYKPSSANNIYWKGKKVSIPAEINESFGGGWSPMQWNQVRISPDLMVLMPNSKFQIVPLWVQPQETFTKIPIMNAQYPPNWANLLGSEIEPWNFENNNARIWNTNHSLVPLVSKDVWKWCAKKFGGRFDKNADINPLPYKKELLSDVSLAASWVIRSFMESSRVEDTWNYLIENTPDFLIKLWKLLFESEEKTTKQIGINICFLRVMKGDTYLQVATPQSFITLNKESMIEKQLPYPNINWRLTDGISQ